MFVIRRHMGNGEVQIWLPIPLPLPKSIIFQPIRWVGTTRLTNQIV